MCVTYWFKIETLRLGNLRNIEEERKASLLVNYESSVIDVVIYQSKRFALEKFNKVNRQLSSIATKQNVNLMLSRVSFETIFSLALLSLVMVPLIFQSYSQTPSVISESVVALVSVIAVRLFPGLARVIQMIQSIAFVWPTVSGWTKNSNIFYEKTISLEFDSTENSQNFVNPQESLLHWNSFQIYRGDNLIIRGNNFHLKPTEFVSIYGKSGSGKTTFLNAIFLHFNSKQKNSAYKIAWIRQTSGFISQNIIENVILSEAESLNQKKLSNAFKMAGLEDSFLKQAETASLRMDQLSGGQVQRINLARAFYHDAKVLLLDEFTSALDSNTELQILETLNRLKSFGFTAIIVSHRKTAKQFSDVIYNIQNNELKILN